LIQEFRDFQRLIVTTRPQTMIDDESRERQMFAVL
jgi:hypothetical protein